MQQFQLGTSVVSGLRDKRGNVALIAAVFGGVAIGCCALAIDFGSLFLERRTLQGAVDVAAMAAAGDLENADAAARDVLNLNKIDQYETFKVDKGRYEPDITLSPEQRFAPGATPYNAARVSVTRPGQLYFAKAFAGPTSIGVSALAARTGEAAFSIGTRLAALRGGLANAILSALLGANVELSVMDYEALIAADVTLQSFLDSLAAELHITAGTYSEVLSSSASLSDVLTAAANVAAADGQPAASAALTALATSGPSATVPLASFIDLGPLANVAVGEMHPGLGGKLNVMSLVSAAASLANGSNQVAVDLKTAIPGVLSLTLDLTIGEPRQHATWVAVGEEGARLQTAQTRLKLVAELLGGGLLSNARIRLPIYIELASAEATLTAIRCNGGDPENATATIAARPGLVKAWIGETSAQSLADFDTDLALSRAALLSAPLLKVWGRADLALDNSTATELEFDLGDVHAKTIKRVETTDLVTSLVSSLVSDLDLDVQIAGLQIGLGQSAVKQALSILLLSAAPALDAIVQNILATAGLHLGEVDVQVHGIRCGRAVLAG